MSLPWLAIGLRILPYVIAAVQAVEKFVKAKGKEKQDAAVEMVATMLAAAEGASGKELLDDAAVLDATRKVIDSVVALQNVIAKRKAAQPPSA